MANTGDLAKLTIFIVACFIGFATGTSWGTIGIMRPWSALCLTGRPRLICCPSVWPLPAPAAYCGDHLSPSPIPPLWLPLVHCYHLNHVSPRSPTASPWLPFPSSSFIIAGLVQNVVICMIIAIALMIVTLFVIKAIVAKSTLVFSGNGRGRQGSCQVSYTPPNKRKPPLGLSFSISMSVYRYKCR